jgi:hypothetical protein
MLSDMAGRSKSSGGAPKKRPARKPPASSPSKSKASRTERSASTRSAAASTGKRDPDDVTFPAALAALLRKRKLSVPKGLVDAPPVAYASQRASFVVQLERLPDGELKRFAEKVAGYAGRQEERARAEWERSPLIAELRKRKLKEPPQPVRVAGVSVSLTKPLAEWSDAELIRAATEWSRIGRT